MDVLSLGKGLKAKKAAQAVSNRLGVDQTKNGPLGIVDVHENVSKRLDALEEKLKGKTITPIVLSTQEDWKKGTVTGMTITANGLSGKGVWETTIQLPVDAVALDKIILEGTNVGIVEIRTKTNEDYQLVKAGGVLSSTFGHIITIKLTSFATTPVIQKLTLTYVTRPMNERLSDLSVHTTINLNKQHLRINALLKQGRFHLQEAVIDDFDDASGIDLNASIGVIYDPNEKRILKDPTAEKAEVHFVKETTSEPVKYALVSYVTNDVSKMTENISTTSGVHHKTQSTEQKITLLPKAIGYEGNGSWESDVIVLPEEIDSVPRITFDSMIKNDTEDITSVEVWVATSINGQQFSEYSLVPEDGFLLERVRFLKIKVILASKGKIVTVPVITFNESTKDLFEPNGFLSFKEDVRLATEYALPMTLDEPFKGEGYIYRSKKIKKNEIRWLTQLRMGGKK